MDHTAIHLHMENEHLNAVLTTTSDFYMTLSNWSNITENDHQEWLQENHFKLKFKLHIPAIVYTAILMVAGLIGNFLVFLVYYFKWKQCSTRIFILALATCDLINCAVTMPTEIALMVDYSILSLSSACKVSRFTTYLCNSTSTMVLIAVAFDRFQRICKPHSHPMTSRKAKLIVLVVFLIAIVLTFPSLIIYGKQTLNIIKGKLPFTVQICLIEDQYVHTYLPLAYFAVHGIGTIITFTIFLVLYSCVGVTVHRHWDFRKRTSSNARRICRNNRSDEYSIDSIIDQQGITEELEPTLFRSHMERCVRTTMILCAVTFAYVASFLPFLVIVIHRTFHPLSWTNLSPQAEMAYHVFLRSYLLNCAINPVIYSFFNDQFRRNCAIVFKQGLSFSFKKNTSQSVATRSMWYIHVCICCYCVVFPNIFH